MGLYFKVMKNRTIVIAGLLSTLFCVSIAVRFNRIINNRKKHIGEIVILQKDTVQILGCSLWDNTYLMSNGQKVDFELIGKLPKP